MTAPPRPHSRARDVAWMVLVVAMVLYALVVLVGTGFGLVEGELWSVVRALPWLLFTYWIGVGAWRRTTWGDPR